MSEEAFNLVKGRLAQRSQAATYGNRKAPTQEEIDSLYSERITPETDLPPMMPLFKMFDVPCFYRGELVADCGRAKSGKTFFLSILMASALKKQVLAMERLTEEPLKVLWIDTEQSQQSTQEIMKERIMPLAEVGKLEDTQFFAFNLRGLGFEIRRKMVDVAVQEVKPDICIIDGIKDLMTDINDAVQATRIMENLMALAKASNCCIVCVLHLNKNEQDWNMRGSIGTELTNKAFEVFQCSI
ncbi:MAG: AAA family ATPase, partial [Prevotella sp.]|nr:AAA family ATPase [Prevotella sp.]